MNGHGWTGLTWIARHSREGGNPRPTGIGVKSHDDDDCFLMSGSILTRTRQRLQTAATLQLAADILLAAAPGNVTFQQLQPRFDLLQEEIAQLAGRCNVRRTSTATEPFRPFPELPGPSRNASSSPGGACTNVHRHYLAIQ